MMAPWSDLPKELVERISKFVNSNIDVLRIRAVCSSWRSAFSPNFKIPKSQFPIKLPSKMPFPHPHMFWPVYDDSHCYLIESTVYLFQLPHPPHTPWLVKILKTSNGKLKILNPLTNRVIDDLPDKKLNLLDLRVSQSGDDKWTTLKDPTSKTVDISVYKDTNVKTKLHGSQPSWKCPKEIKIYRLDEEQHEWIAVHTLGDRIFFVGDDCCFSVSSSDFGDQCRGNCIYYVTEV
ncbi:probable F-box protein At1g65740 [Solanum stenotomum]|uniref:probable F-box protein At1g65740 n=1 Tax=Solanum stenotomum TaxID=172797 RepID=UPI0020D0C2CA|nr:probable F-box protein At1g65740 [Solanum stenotomum]